jgi:hypothetical protein
MITNAKSNVTIFIKLYNDLSQLNASPKIFAYLLWATMVRDGGPWDHKNFIQKMERDAGHSPVFQTVGDSKYHYDTWSNIHYGYVGAAAGFSSEELLEGAGLEQIGTNYYNREPVISQPGISGLKRFDDPYDQTGIQLGISLWKEHSLGLTPEHIIQALESTSSLNRKPIN